MASFPDGTHVFVLCRPAGDPAAKDETIAGTNSARRMNESGLGPKRIVAIAVARLLGVQPGISSTEDSRRPVARVVQP